jgi:hypothetical protein
MERIFRLFLHSVFLRVVKQNKAYTHEEDISAIEQEEKEQTRFP